MKYLKIYDVYFYKGIGKPQVGDYILCTLNPEEINAPKALFDFINTNLGKVVDTTKQLHGVYDTDINAVRYDCTLYVVQWQNIPKKLKKQFITKKSDFDWNGLDVKPGEFRENCLPIQEYEYVEFGKNPEEIEMKISANKYNL